MIIKDPYEVQDSELHDNLLEEFLFFESPNIERKIYKIPLNEKPINFKYNRVILICSDAVYKIYPSEYSSFQEGLVRNLTDFFKYYPYGLNFKAKYKQKICWTKWERIKGIDIGFDEFKYTDWINYLKCAEIWWNEHSRASRNLSVSKGYMWWHDDITPWNVLKTNDGQLYLIDWDDFKHMEVKKAHQNFLDQNLLFAKVKEQETKPLYKMIKNLDCER